MAIARDHRCMRNEYFKRIILALDRAHERRMTAPASILPGELGRTLTGSPLTRRPEDDPGR
jgi:hypothetical protein